jgi:sigma-B regulation protein RsbU (phosphoserine phosphatase)
LNLNRKQRKSTLALLGRDDQLAKLRDENSRLRKSIEELSILNELSSVINSTMSLDKVLDQVVAKSVKAINAEQGTIHLLEKNQQDPFKTLIRKADQTTPRTKFRLDLELSGWMIKYQKPLIINNFEKNDIFKHNPSADTDIRSLLSVPLVAKGRLIGVLNLFNKKNSNAFNSDDQRLLSIIGSQSAQVIENARLYEEEKQFRILEQELEMARDIQARLLPKADPEIEGYEIAGASYAAREVGGDYFDFISLEDSKLGIALGDVSGKGIPAALLMSNLQATLRNQALNPQPLSECIEKANRFLYQSTNSNKFATLFYGVLQPLERIFHYVNAGHNFPYVFRAGGEVDSLEEGGIVVGMLPDISYEHAVCQLSRGDILVIFSDGVTEAENRLEDLYGEQRLMDFVQQRIDLGARELLESIYHEVKTFSGEKPQDDDITLVIIKVL